MYAWAKLFGQQPTDLLGCDVHAEKCFPESRGKRNMLGCYSWCKCVFLHQPQKLACKVLSNAHFWTCPATLLRVGSSVNIEEGEITFAEIL